LDIKYGIENNLSPYEFRELLIASTLGEERPINNWHCLVAMINNANLIITARYDNKLIGIARAFTDVQYCTYLSDLAVHCEFQNRGVGKSLIRATKQAFPEATLILLATPDCSAYYSKIGMVSWDHCFIQK